MRYYKNCRELPIHNFFELSRTGELRYLLKDYDDAGDFQDNEDLQKANIEIIDEYNALFKNKRNESVIKNSELVALEIKLQNLLLIQSILFHSGWTEDLEKQARKTGVELADLDIHIKTIRSQLRKVQNRMKTEAENSENESDNLEKALSLVKENGFNLDRYRTPVIEFAYALNRLEEKANYYDSKKR